MASEAKTTAEPMGAGPHDGPGTLRPPRVVLVITVLWGVILVGYSQLSPLGATPDEGPHMGMVFHLATGAEYPDFDGKLLDREVLDLVLNRHPAWRGSPLTPDNAPESGSRDPISMDSPTDQHNWMPQHPPLYYQTSVAVLRAHRAVFGPRSPDVEWHVVRLTSALMVLPLPYLAWAAARRLGESDHVGVVAAVGVVSVPQLAHIGASVNNDNLLVLLGGLLAVPVAGLLRGDLRRSSALTIGVVVGLALLTKAFAVALGAWVVVAYALRAWRHPTERRAALGAAAWATAAAAAVSSWWWIGNLVRHGELMPRLADEFYTEARRPPDFEPDHLWHLQRFGAWMPRRFWGSFGHFELNLGPMFVVVATAVLGAGLLAVFVRGGHSGRNGGLGSGRLTLAVFGLPALLLLLIVLRRARQVYLATGATQFIQGRYLFAAIVPIMVLAAIGGHRVWGRRAVWGVLGGGVLLHLEAVRTILDGWWGEPDSSLGRSLSSLMAWNPLPIPVVRFVFVAAVVLVPIVVHELREARPRRPGPASRRPGVDR